MRISPVRALSVVLFSFLAPLAAGAAGTAHAAELTAGGRIAEVTVYRDRAEVVREATVAVPAGASHVDFTGLPVSVQADSLRVRGRGVPVTLGTVELRDFAQDAQQTPEWKAAEAEVVRLRDAIAAVEAAEQVDAKLEAFLVGAGDGKEEVDLVALFQLMSTRLSEISDRRLARNERRRTLREQLAVAEAKLRALGPGAGIRSRIARVHLDAARAGDVTLTLAYLAPGASWVPTYRATLDADAAKVDLSYEGIVRQNTGEDWSGVKLRLSTASPNRGVAPPSLPPWILVEPHFQAKAGFARSAEQPVAGRFYQNVLTPAPGVHDAEADVAEEAMIAQAAIVRSAYNVQFEVAGRTDVPGDGSERTVTLQQTTLDAELTHFTAPELDPRAYLSAKTTSPADYPLLAGQVRVFTGGAYLGRFFLQETAPETEMRIPFGVDNRVEVTRLPSPKQVGTRGWTNKTKRIEIVERTRIDNGTSRPITLVVEARVPVPQDERIEVEVDDATTGGATLDEERPGVRTWTIGLPAGDETVVQLQYAVRYPREMNLPDLENR